MRAKYLGIRSVEYNLREDLAAMTAARDHYFAACARMAALLSDALPAVEACDRQNLHTHRPGPERRMVATDLAARITAELETV